LSVRLMPCNAQCRPYFLETLTSVQALTMGLPAGSRVLRRQERRAR
jgi:hypothetical protein